VGRQLLFSSQLLLPGCQLLLSSQLLLPGCQLLLLLLPGCQLLLLLLSGCCKLLYRLLLLLQWKLFNLLRERINSSVFMLLVLRTFLYDEACLILIVHGPEMKSHHIPLSHEWKSNHRIYRWNV
jgi:hypothetical protein